jgi:hypothetical protein
MKAHFLLVNVFGSSQLDYSVVSIDCISPPVFLQRSTDLLNVTTSNISGMVWLQFSPLEQEQDHHLKKGLEDAFYPF